jgi:hypothetical protein
MQKLSAGKFHLFLECFAVSSFAFDACRLDNGHHFSITASAAALTSGKQLSHLIEQFRRRL